MNSRGSRDAGAIPPDTQKRPPNPGGVPPSRPVLPVRSPPGNIRRIMATYTDINYHLVFATKNRVPALTRERRDDLYRFIWGVLKKRGCHLFRIGGVADHIHILTSLHSTVALADLIKEMKTASSDWIKGQRVFPLFDYWQEGYGAFTTDAAGRPGLIEYIKGQEEHHRAKTFAEELEGMVRARGLTWKPDHLP